MTRVRLFQFLKYTDAFLYISDTIESMTTKSFFKLIGSIALCEMAGLVGGLAMRGGESAWYAQLTKPALNPPSWVFAPVWITLYALMGVALYLVITRASRRVRIRGAVVVFFIQLGANALWSHLFFGFHRIDLALIDIVLLLALIVVVMIRFSRISRMAMYLLVPYLIWVSFATYLNFMLWRLN